MREKSLQPANSGEEIIYPRTYGNSVYYHYADWFDGAVTDASYNTIKDIMNHFVDCGLPLGDPSILLEIYEEAEAERIAAEEAEEAEEERQANRPIELKELAQEVLDTIEDEEDNADQIAYVGIDDDGSAWTFANKPETFNGGWTDWTEDKPDMPYIHGDFEALAGELFTLDTLKEAAEG